MLLVEDVVGNIPGQQDGQKVYGDSLCHEYAWINMRNDRIPGGGVNTHVAWNGMFPPPVRFSRSFRHLIDMHYS